jgi:hypothetical protein
MNGQNGLATAATNEGKYMSATTHVRDADAPQETRVSSPPPTTARKVKTWRWRVVLEGGRELRLYGMDEVEAIGKVPAMLPKQQRVLTRAGEQMATMAGEEPSGKVTYIELCGCVYDDGEVNFGGEQGSSFEDYRRAPGA